MNNGIGFKTLCSLLFFVVLIGIQIGNWTRADKATDTLEAEGYTEIVPGDHSWFVCGQGDVSATSFAATRGYTLGLIPLSRIRHARDGAASPAW